MRFLFHITCGPENPSKAALALLAARTALEGSHEVAVFLAGDASQLVRPQVVEHLVGLGTGHLKDHMGALIARGARIYVSGMSAQTRGVDPSALAKSIEAAMPDVLVRLATEADRVLCY